MRLGAFAAVVVLSTACGGKTISTLGNQGIIDGVGGSVSVGGAPISRAGQGGAPVVLTGGMSAGGMAAGGVATAGMASTGGSPVEEPCAQGWSLTSPMSISLGQATRDIVVEAGDLDGDGRPELVTRPQAEIQVFKRQAGFFGLLSSTADDDWSGLGGDIELGDWDKDGLLDVLVEHGSSVSWLRGEPGDKLQPGVVIGAAPGKNDSLTYSRLRFADLDRDGAPDATLRLANVGRLLTLYGDGAGGKTRTTLVPNDGSPSFDDFALIDANDDGLLDLVGIAEGVSPRIQYNNDGVLSWSSMPFGGGPQKGAHSIESGDIDGDGHPDLVISGGEKGPDNLVLLRYATAYQPETIPSDVAPSSIAIADMTGDGYADLVVAHAGQAKLGVYVQCRGRLQAEQLFTIGRAMSYQHSGIAVAQLDDDKCPDVVIGDHDAGLVFLHGSGCMQ